MFSLKQKSERTAAVFDVSSGSVGGSLVQLTWEKNKKTKPVVLAAHRVYLQFQKELQIERYITQTLSAFERAALSLGVNKGSHPEYVQFVLASPWFVSQTRTIHLKKVTPFVFNERVLEEMVTKEVEFVLKNDISQFGSYGKDGVIIERQISQIKLNGYVSNEPFGQHTKEVELNITLTITPKTLLARFREAAHKHYPRARVGFTTAPYTTFVVYRDFIAELSEQIIIDVGEEVTDVAFVKNGMFLYQHSFPVGTYGLVRMLTEGGNHTIAESEALLAAYQNNHLTIEAKKQVSNAVNTFRDVWQKSMQSVLQSGHFGTALPSEVLIVSDPRYEEIYTSSLVSDPVLLHLIASPKPKVIFLKREMIEGAMKGVVMDIALSVAALFVHRQWK